MPQNFSAFHYCLSIARKTESITKLPGIVFRILGRVGYKRMLRDNKERNFLTQEGHHRNQGLAIQ